MPKKSFRYLPIAPGAETWGLVVTAAGFFKTTPGSSYPPEGHPEERRFDWEHGRVLPAFQIFYIQQGSGELESNAQPPQKLAAGSAFLLKPGQWHRLRPDPRMGWTESWVEFQGLVPNALSGAGLLGEAMVCRTGTGDTNLPKAIEAVFERMDRAFPGIDPQMTVLGMEVLIAWTLLWQPRPPPAPLNQALLSAVRILGQVYRQPVNLEALARQLGMSYSTFRRTFQKQTGFAPWKYVQHLRLVNARQRLDSSNDSLEEIASYFGFSSAFHLSAAFRKEFGLSPLHWKNRNKRNSPPAAS